MANIAAKATHIKIVIIVEISIISVPMIKIHLAVSVVK